MRSICSDQRLDAFGERFPVPSEVEYAYAAATVDVARHVLKVQLDVDVFAILSCYLRRLRSAKRLTLVLVNDVMA